MERPGRSDAADEIVNITYHQKGLEVDIGFDPQGPVGGQNFIGISGEGFQIKRHFYFDNSELEVMKAFASRIADEQDFRDASIDGTAAWKQVSDIYVDAAARVEKVFINKGLMGHNIGDEVQKQRHYQARGELKNLCREIFNEIDAQVRSDDLITGLNTFVEDRLTEAESITTEIIQAEYSNEESETEIEIETSKK